MKRYLYLIVCLLAFSSAGYASTPHEDGLAASQAGAGEGLAAQPQSKASPKVQTARFAPPQFPPTRYAQSQIPTTQTDLGLRLTPIRSGGNDVSQTGSAGISGEAAVLPQPDGRAPTVMDFYTDWCGWCRVFEPLFLEAQAKYGTRIHFERANGEAPEYSALVRKYHITSYPTLLYFNADGVLLKAEHGAPVSMKVFEKDLFDAFPELVREAP